jgi:flagellar basal body-associated protein FliL
MAEEANSSPEKSERRATIKTLLIILAVMLLEGGAIVGTMYFTGPSEVEGQGVTADLEAELSKLVEVPVVAEKFPNQRTGRTYLYDTEVFVTVEKRHETRTTQKLDASEARVSSGIATIFRRAEPAHFLEPTLATLRRQIQAVMNETIGNDGEGKPIVQDVLIRKCVPFRADY